MITDGHGTPLAVLLTSGNRNDVTQLLPLLDSIPPVRSQVGLPRRKPDSLFADRGYDHDIYRDQVRARCIVPAIARRGTLHGTGLGTYRWVVERSFAWLHGFRRLRIRWERRADSIRLVTCARSAVFLSPETRIGSLGSLRRFYELRLFPHAHRVAGGPLLWRAMSVAGVWCEGLGCGRP